LCYAKLKPPYMLACPEFSALKIEKANDGRFYVHVVV
jgi:hypothetical protein